MWYMISGTPSNWWVIIYVMLRLWQKLLCVNIQYLTMKSMKTSQPQPLTLHRNQYILIITLIQNIRVDQSCNHRKQTLLIFISLLTSFSIIFISILLLFCILEDVIVIFISVIYKYQELELKIIYDTRQTQTVRHS